MPRTARFRYTKTSRGWLVNVTGKHSKSGRREQRYFSTREKAKEFAARLREQAEEHGKAASLISPLLAEEAHAAAKLLKPFGVSILDVVQRYVATETAAQASVTVEDAIAHFKLAKAHLSEKQQQAVRHMGNHLAEDFPERMLATITTTELAEHIENRTGGDGAFNGKRRLLVTLWRWAAKVPRQWCEASVAENIETRSTVSPEIGILDAQQARAVLSAAEKHFPDCVPGFAIALFTGMRQAEIARLTPSDLTEEGIQVPAASAKTKRRRFVNMPAPLAKWLAAYPIGESVLPPNWRRKEIAVRRLAGFRVWSDLVPALKLKPKLKATPPAKLPEWPDNALRHTHATVALATGATIEQLTFEFGHSGGPQMLRSHYVGAMPKREALAILQIGPHGKTLETIQAA